MEQLAIEITMCAAELVYKWSPDSGSNKAAQTVAHFRVTMKDYVTWHSRISSLIFFIVLLGTGAVLGVVTTLNAMGYPESRFLATGITTLPQEVYSVASNDSVTTDTLSSEESNADDELLYETLPSIASTAESLVLMPQPVDLKLLSDVYHEMSEAELLWRASVGSNRRPRPDSVAPKVAFMFLTRGALPLRPLWERYFRGHRELYNIYVHGHPNYLPNFPPDSVFFRRNIPSKVSSTLFSYMHREFSSLHG